MPASKYRIEDPKNRIFAFKPRAERFFNFFAEGRKVIITNAYHKHSQQMSQDDLGKLRAAASMREDYLRRVREGSYYETEA